MLEDIVSFYYLFQICPALTIQIIGHVIIYFSHTRGRAAKDHKAPGRGKKKNAASGTREAEAAAEKRAAKEGEAAPGTGGKRAAKES